VRHREAKIKDHRLISIKSHPLHRILFFRISIIKLDDMDDVFVIIIIIYS
jgi:hypothetical protein